MIVNIPVTPILALVMEDVALRSGRVAATPPEDGIRMGIPGREIIGHDAVVAFESATVVVPMDRHGEGIADERAPDSIANALGAVDDGSERSSGGKSGA